MFKKILIPTDGSPLSAQAANAGISFARPWAPKSLPCT